MSDDDPTDRTLLDAVRNAARGKIDVRGQDRRVSDRLTLKDWAGYVLVIAGPVCAALWSTHQSVTRMEIEVATLQREADKAEEARAALWRRLGDHLEQH